MISQTENNSILEYFRPHGKIVCVGDLTAELQILQEYLAIKTESRLPLLLLTTINSTKTSMCDQVVIFESETMFSQIKSLLNSFFLPPAAYSYKADMFIIHIVRRKARKNGIVYCQIFGF